MNPREGKIDHLLVGVSGSIAILGLPAYLAAFRAHLAHEVQVIMTHAAASLLPPSTVALLCDAVHTDDRRPDRAQPGHVELARWASLFVTIPATANVLGQAAHGLAPDLLTSAILASPRPVVFFANMNDLMWRKRAVRRNVDLLREDGHMVVEPLLTTAYEIASGCLRENWVLSRPDQVVEQLRAIYRQQAGSGPEVPARHG